MSLKNWVFLLTLAVSSGAAGVSLADAVSSPRTIVVLGEAQVSAPPDKAVISLGARHTAKSAAEALAKTSEAVGAILSRMEQMGIDPKDVQTSNLSLNPLWGKSRSYEEGEIAAPIGFEAANTVRVTLRDLDRLGEMLDLVTREGANAFSGFQFGLIDPEPVRDEARSAAVTDARRKAELYARAAGVRLGEVLLLSEDLSGAAQFPQPMMEMSMARSSTVPIAQGEVSQSASVKVIYAISE